MNNDRLKDLNKKLWDTADELRANTGLKASEYATLKGQRQEKTIQEIAMERCGLYLPQESRYNYLLNLREEQDIAKNIKAAIEEIEKYSSELVGMAL